jgi:hypothetical protein
MMTAELMSNGYQLGPFQIWPIHLTKPSAHIYSTPPFKSGLNVAEVDLGDGPRVEMIQVINKSSKDFLIPAGWVVGAQLLQVRTFVDAVYVAAHQSVYAAVSCVEQGRWGAGTNQLDGGRAPITVHTAGWEYIPGRNPWRLSHAERQVKVWEQVARQESRSGARPTHSLSQVMDEDASGVDEISRIRTEVSRNYSHLPNQHGALVTFDSEPLFMETFSDPDAAKRVIKATLSSLAFDVQSSYFVETPADATQQFLAEAQEIQLEHLSENGWAILMAGGNGRLHSRTSMDRDGRALHSLTINKSHRILQEV